MKPIIMAQLTIALMLSASSTTVYQDPGFHPSTFSSRIVQIDKRSSGQPAAAYPVRSSWSGYHLNATRSRGNFSLHPTRVIPSRPSLSPSACEPAEDICITQHHFSFQYPFSSFYNTAIEPSYLYGTTQFGSLAPHHGVEILNPTGTPVLAVEGGVVIVAGNDAHSEYGPWENFYGNLVVLEHHLPDTEEPVYTLYGHLSTIQVQVGETVEKGDVVGEVGSTGRAIGSHLHFEVRVGANQYANTRNPALWLYPHNEDGESEGALAGKLESGHGNPIYATIKIEYYPDINGPPDKTFFVETYATEIDPFTSDDTYQENFVLTDLVPGFYRIALSASGAWTDRWVEVEPGKLSFVTIVSK